MHMMGLARLGRDVEVRFAPSGDAVANLSLAFNYGKKGDDGKRPSEWVEAAMWGQRAQSLAPYLKKGGLVSVVLEDPHIESYEGHNGAGHKLVARVVNVELAGGRDASDGQAANQHTSKPAAGTPPKTGGGGGSGKPSFDDLDDDIPFICHSMEADPIHRRRVARTV